MIKYIRFFVLMCAFLSIAACGGGSSVSTLPTSDSFDESDLDFNPKMDILWVVDPSKSMYEEVELVRNNIQAFVSDFITKGYEYRMGVISTAAWSEEAYQDDNSLNYLREGGKPVFARLHKGECIDYANSSGNNEYLDYLNAAGIGDFMTQFQTNFDVYGVGLGTSGCGLVGPPFGDFSGVANNIFNESSFTQTDRAALGGYIDDERPLQSIRAFLKHDQSLPQGDRFIRDDAYLAVIVISDEKDASRKILTPNLQCDPADTNCKDTAQEYINDLSSNIKDSVNKFGIYSIIDETLPENISKDAADLSGGLSFDINSDQEDYVKNLNKIADAILVEATAYPLAYEPVVSSIHIEILKPDGSVVNVPKDDGSGSGWTYNETTQSVVFSSDYLPTREDAITVDYTPARLISGISNEPRLDFPGNEITENAVDGTDLGAVSLRNGDATDGVYSITSDSSGGGFAIDSATGIISVVDTTKIDTEVSPRVEIDVNLTLPDTTELDRSFIIKILDEPDASPVAADDDFKGYEAAADVNGDILITGNVSYNDSGLDASETHTFAISGSGPPQGSVIFNSDGSFEYTVAASSLGLNAGDTANISFDYSVEDQASNSDTATVSITIFGNNQGPVLYNPIADQSVEFDATVKSIPFVDTDITVSGGSNKANLIDEDPVSFFASTSSGTHFITMEFPSGTPLFEVQKFNIKASGSYSLGNAILQVLSADDRVLTREVLPVDQSGSANLSVDMKNQVIGNKVKIMRPVGAVNPNGEQDLQIAEVEVKGIEVEVGKVNLDDHFSDPDLETLTYYATDIYGEGPAPSWVSIAGSELRFVPPAGAEATIGVLAEDPSGATEFTTLTITRQGAGTANNAGPISLLALDDAKRGGVSLKRFGGGTEDGSDASNDKRVRHGENENFLINPYAGQAIRDALTAAGVGTLENSTYATVSNIPQAIRNDLIAAGHADQLPHFGDHYGAENGWPITPIYEDDKYPNSSIANCNNSAYGAGTYGRILPCINSLRGYGETYTGYFVPAKTGVFRFKAASSIDDVARLLMAPTEYVEDLKPVVTTSYPNSKMTNMMASLYELTGPVPGPTSTSEFSPNNPGVGHDTNIFFLEDPTSYKDGYVYLKQGNVYAFEIRFAEGSGDVRFEFEYDRKDQGTSSWDGWKAIDASVIVPASGADAHTERVIAASGGSVSFDASQLFYDAEDDALDYTARLVKADGTDYVGPNGTSNISEIGLTLSVQSAALSGTLNAAYTSDQPRIIFKAKERYTDDHAEIESLPIKFSN